MRPDGGITLAIEVRSTFGGHPEGDGVIDSLTLPEVEWEGLTPSETGVDREWIVPERVARRFGWRGLAVFVAAVAVIGPPRDYLIAARFPDWMVFAPGVTPILADGAT